MIILAYIVTVVWADIVQGLFIVIILHTFHYSEIETLLQTLQ